MMRQAAEPTESTSRRVFLNDEMGQPSEEGGGAGGGGGGEEEGGKRDEDEQVWARLWYRFSVEAGGMAFPCGKYAGMPLRDVPYTHLQCLRHLVESELATAVAESVRSKSDLHKQRRERRARRALVKKNSALVEQIRARFSAYYPSFDWALCRKRPRSEVLRALNSYFCALY
jgi:hypothetical protein